MNDTEGEIYNPSTGDNIPIWREAKRWCVRLEDIESVNYTEPTYPSTQSSSDVNELLTALNSSTLGEADSDIISTGTRLRVIELHQRMGHGNVEAMLCRQRSKTHVVQHGFECITNPPSDA